MLRIVALWVIVFVAGLAVACGGESDSNPTATSTVAASPTEAPTSTPAATATPTPEPTPEPTATPEPTPEPPPPTVSQPQPTPRPPAPPPPSLPRAVSIAATNLAFTSSVISVPANSNVTVTLRNNDSGVPHDFASALGSSAICTGPCTTVATLSTGAPGSYQFRCSVHPSDMVGTIRVQ